MRATSTKKNMARLETMARTNCSKIGGAVLNICVTLGATLGSTLDHSDRRRSDSAGAERWAGNAASGHAEGRLTDRAGRPRRATTRRRNMRDGLI